MAASHLPRIYPILDVAQWKARAPEARSSLSSLMHFAEELMEGGAALIQYRNKSGTAREILGHARELRRLTRERARLIVNDRIDLCLAAGGDGVHLGQDDLSPAAARQIAESVARGEPGAVLEAGFWIGFSTHCLEQVREADGMPVDYIAVGPVFATGSKANPDPVIGVEGVRRARGATAKPLVAIGGITRENCGRVIEAGADSVAVISDLVQSPRKAMR